MAKWLYDAGDRYCDACGYEYDKINSQGEYQAAFYCPWCGEKMEDE